LSCPRCAGTGFEILERDGGEFARPCSCRRTGEHPEDDFVAR